MLKPDCDVWSTAAWPSPIQCLAIVATKRIGLTVGGYHAGTPLQDEHRKARWPRQGAERYEARTRHTQVVAPCCLRALTLLRYPTHMGGGGGPMGTGSDEEHYPSRRHSAGCACLLYRQRRWDGTARWTSGRLGQILRK